MNQDHISYHLPKSLKDQLQFLAEALNIPFYIIKVGDNEN